MKWKKWKLELGGLCALAFVAAPAIACAQQGEDVTGLVQSVSSDASSIVVELANGSPISCAYGKDAALFDAVGNSMTGAPIKPGDTITVSGTMEAGCLVANKVVFARVFPIVQRHCHPISW